MEPGTGFVSLGTSGQVFLASDRHAPPADPTVQGFCHALPDRWCRVAALLNGAKRGLFSNEAGMGSAPNAAATATTSHPVKQGLIQSLGVFVDTIVVCSATAFMPPPQKSRSRPRCSGVMSPGLAVYTTGTPAAWQAARRAAMLAITSVTGWVPSV